MLECNLDLDSVFGSLADGTRRDILRRVLDSPLSVSEIAKSYNISLAAISLHLKVLEKAKLILKTRHGKQQIVSIAPLALKDAAEYLHLYETTWQESFAALDIVLKQDETA